MKNPPPCPLPEETMIAAPCPPLDAERAKAEAARCLSTRPCQGCEICQLMCPDQAITRDDVTHQPVIDLTYCKGCGLCAHFCPKRAITMELEQAGD
jgi:2-oxoacid:acceptor oxidoreductase delta subunit (pyruvate/2-ketoisovalerate family)